MNKRTSGFTLIELMITVAVIGILASIAYPSYTEWVVKSRRSEGKSRLLEIAQRQERYYTERNTYTTDFTQLGYASGTLTSENGYYTLTVAATSGNTIVNSFTATATRARTQTADTKCGNLTLTNANVKGVTGTSTVADCW